MDRLGKVSFGWDKVLDKPRLWINGIPHQELEKFVKKEEISRHKIVNSSDVR